jgi:hypothetical protein
MRRCRRIAFALAFTCASSAFAIDIVINPGAALSANPDALAAFNRAAAQWESRLSDPITVTIDANIAPLGIPTAQTNSVFILRTFNNVRNLMVADALDEGADDLIVASLPTYETFTAALPADTSLNGGMILTKANLKALGVTGLDTQFGVSDGSITFNSNFAFDYDNSNGVGAGLKDFESAAMHELGHALGFQSVAGSTGTMLPVPLDLFRFQNGAADVDPTLATFATTPRSLVVGGAPIFDDGVTEWAVSPGNDGTFVGHWKDDNITGNLIGVMDPSIAFGQMFTITSADLRAFDLTGYEVTTVPEPSSLVALTLGAIGLRRRRSNRRS